MMLRFPCVPFFFAGRVNFIPDSAPVCPLQSLLSSRCRGFFSSFQHRTHFWFLSRPSGLVPGQCPVFFPRVRRFSPFVFRFRLKLPGSFHEYKTPDSAFPSFVFDRYQFDQFLRVVSNQFFRLFLFGRRPTFFFSPGAFSAG